MDQPKHTPGLWRQGERASEIIADPTGEDATAYAQVIKLYGGILIAESVLPKNAPLIIAAPQLLSLLRTWHGLIARQTADKNGWRTVRVSDFDLNHIESVIRASMGAA